MTRRAPRWTIPFLRALEHTGEVRAAAEDAGIDWSTAYARRRAHPEFAKAWDGALRLRAERAVEEERVAVAALHEKAPPPHSMRSPSPRFLGEDVMAGAQLKRAGHGRWSQAREKRFFEELAATANVKRAAAAAGVSPNAVYARRLKQPLFKAKWAAVLETGRASIEMHLVEAANRSFDADEIETGEVQPKVSIDQAIKITQSSASKAQREALPNPFEVEDEADPLDDLKERLIRKLERLRKRDVAEKQAAGWSYDESYDMLIPPGWVMGPDYVPREVVLRGDPEE